MHHVAQNDIKYKMSHKILGKFEPIACLRYIIYYVPNRKLVNSPDHLLIIEQRLLLGIRGCKSSVFMSQ